jgi:hypothetical protein
MDGEGDVSHFLSEYFGSCRGGVGPGALTGVLAQIRKGYSLTVFGVAGGGSAAAIPAPFVRLVSAQAVCNLLPAVLGSELGKSTGLKSMARARHHWARRRPPGVALSSAPTERTPTGAAAPCGTVDVSTRNAWATTRKMRVICGPDPGDSQSSGVAVSGGA